jgi:hypothetical protein
MICPTDKPRSLSTAGGSTATVLLPYFLSVTSMDFLGVKRMNWFTFYDVLTSKEGIVEHLLAVELTI